MKASRWGLMLVAALLVGCTEGGVPVDEPDGGAVDTTTDEPDAASDPEPDVAITPDVAPEVEVTPDVPPEVEVTPDVPPDIEPDTGPDTEPDIVEPDVVEPDVVEPPPPPSDPGFVKLLDPLDEPELYCLDVAGHGDDVQLQSPLTAHTCKGGTPDDQIFVANDPAPGMLRMPAYDLCVRSDGVWLTATVSLAACDDTDAMQLWRLRDDDRIQLHVLNFGLCIAVADGDGEPANGPSHLRRDLDLQDCDTIDASRSQWEVPGGVLQPLDSALACEALVADIEALVADHQSCKAAGECELLEQPYCGSAGCYQRAVTDTESLPEELWELTSLASTIYCEPFSCGCWYESFPTCLDQTCTLCPGPDCQLECDALIAQLVAEVQARNTCTTAEDCVGLDTTLCTVPELGCYQAAVSNAGTWGIVPALIQMVADQGCAVADCDCDDAQVACTDGRCVSVP